MLKCIGSLLLRYYSIPLQIGCIYSWGYNIFSVLAYYRKANKTSSIRFKLLYFICRGFVLLLV